MKPWTKQEGGLGDGGYLTILLIYTVAVYVMGVLQGPFLEDIAIIDNKISIKNHLYFRPVWVLFMWCESLLNVPFFFCKIFNLLLFLVILYLLYFILKETIGSGRTFITLMFFVASPIVAFPVSWVSQSNDLLSLLFFLLYWGKKESGYYFLLLSFLSKETFIPFSFLYFFKSENREIKYGIVKSLTIYLFGVFIFKMSGLKMAYIQGDTVLKSQTSFVKLFGYIVHYLESMMYVIFPIQLCNGEFDIIIMGSFFILFLYLMATRIKTDLLILYLLFLFPGIFVPVPRVFFISSLMFSIFISEFLIDRKNVVLMVAYLFFCLKINILNVQCLHLGKSENLHIDKWRELKRDLFRKIIRSLKNKENPK